MADPPSMIRLRESAEREATAAAPPAPPAKPAPKKPKRKKGAR